MSITAFSESRALEPDELAAAPVHYPRPSVLAARLRLTTDARVRQQIGVVAWALALVLACALILLLLVFGPGVAGRPAGELAECLRELERAESVLTAARAKVLAGFTAQAGPAGDGHRSARA